MRGTLAVRHILAVRFGLIPTYAGNTNGFEFHAARYWAHPHVCGEHSQPGVQTRMGVGSSPRMRGTRANKLALPSNKGLIPTYAGNTSYRLIGGHDLRAHPHVCGEHFPIHAIRSRAWGSSPRMRGTLKAGADRADAEGLIPTYAGNTRLLFPGC